MFHSVPAIVLRLHVIANPEEAGCEVTG